MADFNRFGNMMPPQECKEKPYLLDRDPFRIVGNLYFVGNLWCSSHLIDTGNGLILLDVPTGDNLTGLVDNIYRLGFRLRDLKYILVSHAHADHYGAVNALVHMTGAKTFMGRVDTESMQANREKMESMNRGIGYYNECFVPDVQLEDGDVIELGNTKIRCVLTPGHTVGVMSHFWTAYDGEKAYKVGIYGGAGFVSVSREALERDNLPLSMQQTFSDSIDKVWNEPVDICLGNHPFHNDTYQKAAVMQAGGPNGFIDPAAWQVFLQELRDRYAHFLTLTPAEVAEMYRYSQWETYVGMIAQAEAAAK